MTVMVVAFVVQSLILLQNTPVDIVAGLVAVHSAVEEKSSRVVEVLLGTVRPWQLLSGKIVALTALTFIKMGLMVGAGLAANAAVSAYDLPAATTAVVAWSLAFTLVGFVFYAALFTVAGTLWSSVEDAQAAAGPLMLTVMGRLPTRGRHGDPRPASFSRT